MSLFKRPNSKFWWMKFTFDGQLIQQSTQVANKRDALTVESAYRTQLALGKIGVEQKRKAPTFDKAVQDFLKWSQMERAKNTHDRIVYSFQPLLSYFGKVKIDKIESKDIENFVLERSRQKSRKTKDFITRETINRELCVLKMLFRRLVDNEVIKKNPARKIKQLSENERKFHVLTPEEKKLYLLAAPQPLQDIAGLLLETGMRCGEVYRIKKDEVFLSEGFLKVTKSKTRSSIRRVHLSVKAQKILSARISKFDGEYLFPQNDKDGEQATGSLVYLHLKTIRRLGFNFRLYDCRHTFATRAVENGIDLVVLASILGHANLKMIMRYAHPSEKNKAEAIRKMENGKAKAV
jgi:integrase